MPRNETDDNTPIPAADLEPASANAPLGAQEMPRFDSPACIHVHSIRTRLTDSDGISAKAAIDGIVYAGILADDSPAEVKQVSYSQAKVSGK